MGAYVFNNEIFDSWLNKKADEILSKVNREMITTEEMIVLILKAQTNHFSHMDHDLKLAIQKAHDEIGHIRDDNEKLENSLRSDMNKMESSIRGDMVKIESSLRGDMNKMEDGIRRDMTKMEEGIRFDMNKMETGIRTDMNKMETGIRSDMDLRFNIVDKRFDRVYTLLQWSMGIMTALFGGVYLKLFLG
jgi:hypothetical protein